MKNKETAILKMLAEKETVSVAELSELLGCSAVTVRKYLANMEKMHLLIRTHGGAARVTSKLNLMIRPGNVYQHPEEKQRIAERAYFYIENNDTIVLDDSSIAYYLAEYIRDHNSKNMIVLTNSLAVAVLLSDLSEITLFMIGGQIGGKLPSAIGEIAMSTVSGFKANKAFISAHSINFDAGVTTIGSPQMQVKKAILDVTDDIYILADSSKFGNSYVMVFCGLDRVKKIITDSGLSKESIAMAEEKHVDIDIV